MDEQLNDAPCGFLNLSKDGTVLSINQTLIHLLGYKNTDQLVGQHINSILTASARVFLQLYFMPLIMVEHTVEEMYLSLAPRSGEEVPVLINASLNRNNGNTVIVCVIIPMRRRSEYENQLIIARKLAEDASNEKSKANAQLETALKKLEAKQEELLKVNKQNQKYKIETQEELKLAKKIQETSLTAPIYNENLQIDSYYRASSELSGDTYGFYQINKHQYGVILLDVMGHGISASLITMSLQSLFQKLVSKGSAPDFVMKELDNHLHHLFQSNEEAWHYCTAIYLLIDTNKQTIEYTNAGHPPAIYQDSNGIQQEFGAMTPPIGSLEGIHFKSETITYKPGSKLLLYTDGVSEPLGLTRLSSLLKENKSLALNRFKEKIIYSLETEGDNRFKNDDQCFILIGLE
ncbi:SpoIIE family protein phosphatase [Oceanobacillus damuensis]|uniref:SpoIIE family protein phosphatase n=1 Tax=Oceanobacillus damuensis TaxID=937928 RepID=UPI00082E37E0|nr:SpoIIE family protein phosphatase [Oceanobacillus damuensis]